MTILTWIANTWATTCRIRRPGRKRRAAGRFKLFRRGSMETLESRRLLSVDLVSRVDPGFLSGSGDGPSYTAHIAGRRTVSDDGRYAVFSSAADNLVPGDKNQATDVFLYDQQLHTITLVSVNRFGSGSGNGASDSPTISADGKVVAFRSYASNLAGNDSNRSDDVFVRDLGAVTPATILVSVNSAGTQSGNGRSNDPVLSANDGRLRHAAA